MNSTSSCALMIIHGRLWLLRILTITGLIITCTSSLLAQATFESAQSGRWSYASTWHLISGSSANGIPDSLDAITVKTGHIVSLGNLAGRCATLQVDAGGTLLIDSTANVSVYASNGSATVNGTLTMGGSGTLRKQGTGTRSLILGSAGRITISGSAPNPSFDTYTFDLNSTFEYTAPANQNVLAGVQFGNLTLAGSGTKTVAPVPPDTAFRCAGTLNVGSGVTFDVSTNILRIYFMGDVINSGSINASVGITVLYMTGANWINNGSYLPSTTPGYGYVPTTTFTNTVLSGTPVSQSFDHLVFQGSCTTQTNLVVQGSLTVSSGATLSASGNVTYQVQGNWVNDGNFNPGTSTVTLNDPNTQTVSGSTFYNLVINTPNGVSLTGNTTIVAGGSLTLTNGSLSTGPYTLTIDASDPAALSLGANRIIGNLVRAIASGSTGTYYLFDANSFIIPNGTGNPSNINATAFPNTNPPNMASGADTSKIAKRYYQISATGLGLGFSYTMRLSYQQSEVRGNEFTYVLWENGGPGWAQMGCASRDTAANYVQQTGLKGFSNWAMGEPSGALPIQLASFGASLIPNSSSVRLTWSTLSETNNFGFYVEQSIGSPLTFVTLQNSFVPGHGTTLTPQQYAWTLAGLAPGAYYYRLKQLDLDGTAHYTDAVKLDVQAPTGVNDLQVPQVFALDQNYPNPFNPTTVIRFSVETTGQARLQVYNVIGQEIATLFSGLAQAGTPYTINFDGSSLPNGAYFYRLTSANQTLLRKMLLLK